MIVKWRSSGQLPVTSQSVFQSQGNFLRHINTYVQLTIISRPYVQCSLACTHVYMYRFTDNSHPEAENSGYEANSACDEPTQFTVYTHSRECTIESTPYPINLVQCISEIAARSTQ